MFIISHDMECSLVCDKAAILRNGRLLEFRKPQELIETLPSNGKLARFTIEKLNEKKINLFKSYPSVKKIIRVGNEVIEVFLNDLDNELSELTQHVMNKGLKVQAMSRDVASFRRYFQLRIQEEEAKEKRMREHDEM